MHKNSTAFVTAAAATAVTMCLVFYPELAFAAALRGLRIWWFVVFPALLPFFIAGQVLMALGAVHFLGVLLERFMRPLFNVPGVGAFVVAMGLASGYPIGAVLTAKLHRDGQLNTAEAERLMSFCNTADPLFMAGAVAVGMFGNASLAGAIMGSHYLAALGTGLVLRFHRRREASAEPAATTPGGLWARACSALVEARARDGRAFGQILGDAVRDSVNTLLLVGGFIILFAVVIDILGKVGVVAAAGAVLTWALHPIGVTSAGASSLVSGFFEITIGTKAATQAAAPLLQRLMLCNVIIAWSGISVFAQVAAVTQGTGISLRPYVLARMLQAVLAGALTFVFWNPAWSTSPAVIPALASIGPSGQGLGTLSWGGWLEDSSGLLAAVLGLTLIAVVAAAGASGAAVIAWRRRAG